MEVAVLFFLGLIVGGGFLVVALIQSFIQGWLAFGRSRSYNGELAATLRFLGLNLCEPLVNIVLVIVLWRLFGNRSPLLYTAPMAVLLVPAIGLWFTDHNYRELCFKLCGWGSARWGLNIVIFSLLYSNVVPILFLMIPLAIALLWFSYSWGKQQLNILLLSAPSPYAVPTAGPATAQAAAPVVQAGRVAPLPTPQVAPAPVRDFGPPVLCPLCHTPTAMHDEACTACGLVFRSRIPTALQSLERYHVLRPLGSGGMSSVYLARDRVGGTLCVLKTLLSVDEWTDATWREEAARCLEHEAALLSQLDHPRIARLNDKVSSAQGEFLVLEYIAGLTLEQRLTHAGGDGVLIPGAALAPGIALAYAASVAETLTYLAALPHPVMHLDIKPANLIMPPGQAAPVLVDFGGAALVRREAATHTKLLGSYGTPGYAAPEQYRGRSTLQSDIYGLAATLYHLLTDDDPGAHPLAFPQLAALPADIAAVLRPALADEPDARPRAAQFSAELQRLAELYALPTAPVLAAGGIYRVTLTGGSRHGGHTA